ncbi:MAG TPA: ribosome maturation factor RimM [Bacteroidales bacterium]|nr:ribosome maturation factor RimM [Bacteroidales bacterium]HRZ75968.1 ribosome maturation factor RimM [Bacteroidales bacterium]
MSSRGLIRIGKIGKTFGTQGEVILDLVHRQVSIDPNEPVFLAIQGTRVPFFLTSLHRRSDGRYLLTLDGVGSPEQAQAYLQAEVFIEQNPSESPDEGELLITELVGYQVIDEVHGLLGQVADILEYPEQDMLLIRHQDQELLLPLADDYITGLDVEGRRLHLQTPEGLIDLLLGNS